MPVNFGGTGLALSSTWDGAASACQNIYFVPQVHDNHLPSTYKGCRVPTYYYGFQIIGIEFKIVLIAMDGGRWVDLVSQARETASADPSTIDWPGRLPCMEPWGRS